MWWWNQAEANTLGLKSENSAVSTKLYPAQSSAPHWHCSQRLLESTKRIKVPATIPQVPIPVSFLTKRLCMCSRFIFLLLKLLSLHCSYLGTFHIMIYLTFPCKLQVAVNRQFVYHCSEPMATRHMFLVHSQRRLI